MKFKHFIGQGKVKTFVNFHTNGAWYNTTLFTSVFNKNYFYGWSIEGTINHVLKKEMYMQLLNGMEYKFYLSFIRSIFTKRYNKRR